MNKRREFLKNAGAATAGAVAASTLSAPYVKAQTTIKWRLQTYAGAALADRYGVVSYPTVVLIDPAGNEVTRARGALPPEAFAAWLDDALRRAESGDYPRRTAAISM